MKNCLQKTWYNYYGEARIHRTVLWCKEKGHQIGSKNSTTKLIFGLRTLKQYLFSKILYGKISLIFLFLLFETSVSLYTTTAFPDSSNSECFWYLFLYLKNKVSNILLLLYYERQDSRTPIKLKSLQPILLRGKKLSAQQ